MRYFLIIMLLITSVFAKEATVEQLFNVQTVKVKQVTHAKSFKSFGFVQVDEASIYDVSPRFSGYVEKLYAKKTYSKVTKGQVLAKVYSPEVLKAKDDYINTLNYAKTRPNKTMLNSAKTKLELLNIPHAEIVTIEKKKKSSHFTNILAPASGFIFKKVLNSNSSFMAKQKIFEIVNLDKVWIEVKIHQEQLKDLKKVDMFSIKTPAYENIFDAKASIIYPKLDKKEEAFTLRLEVTNKKHLLMPGMYTSVEMSSVEENYLTLPATAVIRKNAKFYVFGVGEYEGEYEPFEIEVDVLNPDIYIVKSGLSEGDEVVNNALFMMDSDAQVNGLY